MKQVHVFQDGQIAVSDTANGVTVKMIATTSKGVIEQSNSSEITNTEFKELKKSDSPKRQKMLDAIIDRENKLDMKGKNL